jgi:hypothetical protein
LRFGQVTAWRQAAPLVAALFVVVLFVVASREGAVFSVGAFLHSREIGAYCAWWKALRFSTLRITSCLSLRGIHLLCRFYSRLRLAQPFVAIAKVGNRQPAAFF